MNADSGSLATIVRDGRPGPAIEAGDFKRAFARFQKDQVTDHAAALTYYALMSLFPALLFGVALLGFFGQAGPDHRRRRASSSPSGRPPPRSTRSPARSRARRRAAAPR